MRKSANRVEKDVRHRRLLLGSVAGCAIVILTGCGDGSPSGDDGPTANGSGAEELTTISVGTLPIASSAELRFGVSEGIFAEHGLDVELVEGQGGAELLPAVQNQSLAIAVGNPMSVLTAAERGLDVKVISGYSWSSASGEDINAVVTRADSGIEEFTDLENRVVTVNALHTLGDLSILESVDQQGGDPSSVRFNEMAFPDMLPQLEEGNVDAVWIPDPFLGMALEDPENVVVGHPNQVAMESMPLTIAFTSSAFAEENPEVIQAFTDALTESTEAAWEDEDALRSSIASSLNMDEAVAQRIRLEPAHTDLPTETLQQVYDLMLKYGMATDPLDVESLYVSDE
ncbi:ABC transporter substrate-binding protein [Citricoccus muralis]|uniref:ABC transporter substrate-binding protein n=1 Tax=Citricoccus muralis TaxID=169134 RepID=A0ABY8H7X6_9MICC|nr:ABC transporter substrate-binding protein [Citricoccus muralis]WFP17036.1 ABC transporter substrate-binding protein [Citricoccus muralis]